MRNRVVAGVGIALLLAVLGLSWGLYKSTVHVGVLMQELAATRDDLEVQARAYRGAAKAASTARAKAAEASTRLKEAMKNEVVRDWMDQPLPDGVRGVDP